MSARVPLSGEVMAHALGPLVAAGNEVAATYLVRLLAADDPDAEARAIGLEVRVHAERVIAAWEAIPAEVKALLHESN